MATKKKKPSQGIAIAALLLNILVIPGLGTIIGGRTSEGVIQLVLSVVSLPLMLIFIGFPLLIGMWIWALVSGIQIIKESEA
jgi:TM2 domain-containing membrane protein YozV